ncbi:MAG: hypothetical protein KAR17_12720 [Cyclobacteriaceae bacterium]|nr:hypothetical protein [Cyclobacteriaceae bacterium]
MTSFKVLIKIVFIALLAYLFQITPAPWWSVVVASLLMNFIISTKGLSSFVSGFLGIEILWLLLASIIDIHTDSILTERVAGIFSLPNSWLLVLITSVIGGLAGGFGALTGYHLRNLIMPTD